METSLSLETIYKMLSSLSDSNKKWLADHLYEDVEKSQNVHRHKALSDEELEAELSGFQDLDMEQYTPLTDEQYKSLLKSKPIRTNVLKWL